MKETIYVCPECGSDRVTTEHRQKFMVNTGDHYCHSMKPQDADSPQLAWTANGRGAP